MSVVVAYKWAPNPQDAIVGSDGAIDWSRAKPAISEYDPTAIQVGRLLADTGSVECVGISVGSSAVASSLAKKAAMSRGLDRGLVVADDAAPAWNLTQVAHVLATLVEQVGSADIVITGDASIDENARMVPALIAGHLGWPCFQDVVAVERHEHGWLLGQAIPCGTRDIAVTGPVVISVTPDAVQPRIPGMKDIMAAGKKVVDAVDPGLVPAVGLETVSRERPATRPRQNKVFQGSSAATDLAAALRAAGAL